MVRRPLHETDEHATLRLSARRFAERFLSPKAHEFEETGTFPRSLYLELASAGLLGVGYPEDLGGSGGDLSHVLAVADELILHGKTVGTLASLGSHGIALPPILRLGSKDQLERLVRPCLTGEKIAALAITEPSGGSDVSGLTTTARREGDFYVVQGEKTFITSGTRADIFTVAVRTGAPDSRSKGISLLVVERGTEGFSTSGPLKKMGWWSSDTASLHFEQARVPARNLLGEEGTGFLSIMMNFATERILLAANCVSIAQLAFNETLAYCRERHTFGKPLIAHQVVQHKLADMLSRIEAARALTNEALLRTLSGEMAASLCAMAKNVATDMVCAVCDDAVQLHGGAGYMRETVVERLFRDARLYPIGGGAREIMNELIVKAEGFQAR